MAERLLFTVRWEYTDNSLLARVHALKPNGSIDHWIETREYGLDADRAEIVEGIIRELRDGGRVVVYQPGFPAPSPSP